MVVRTFPVSSRFAVLFLLLALVMVVAACGGGAASTPTTAPALGTNAPAGTNAAPATQQATSAAPAATSSTGGGSGAPVTITFFYPVAVPGPITQIIDGYIQKFQQQNPNIKVNAVLSGGYPDTMTKIQTTIKGGGTPPDVAVLLSTDLYTLVDSDAIVPLDDYVKAAGGDQFTSDFQPAFLANSNYQNHIWSLPF